MSDDNSAQEPTNFPVGSKDEVPSNSPEKVESPTPASTTPVPNDTPAQDTADAKAAGESGDANPVGGVAADGPSIETPATDPNRAAAE